MSLRIRRGLEEDRSSITPAQGEPIFTTDRKELFFGDGVTPGGNSVFLIKEKSVNLSSPVPGESQLLLHQVSSQDYTSIKYIIQASSNDTRQLSELLVTHNGTNAYMVEYGVVNSTDNGTRLATFNVTLEENTIKLLVIPNQGGQINFQVQAQLIRT